MEAMRPYDADRLEAFRKAYGPAFRHSLAAEYPKEVRGEDRGSNEFEGIPVKKLIIGNVIPALLFTPKSPVGTTLVVHEQGKEAVLEGNLLKKLLAKKQAVLAIDCFNTGEHVGAPESADRLTRYKFFDTYNRTDAANRIQDILTSLSYVECEYSSVNLIGVGDAGLWCMLARALAPKVNMTVVNACGFDTSDDQVFVEKCYVPCLRRAGDFRAAGALIAPGKMLIHNTRGRFKTDWIEDTYKAVGQPSCLAVQASRASDDLIADWLK